MLLELHFITGFMIGCEWVNEYEDANHLVLDLGIVRLMGSFPKGDTEFEV
jgi:hypothetical protein